MNQIRMFWLVVRHETRMLLAERSLLVVCGLLALMIGYGFHNGLEQTRIRDGMVAEVMKSQAASAERNIASLRKVTAGEVKPGPFENPANPATIGNGSGRYAAIPSAVLAPVAIGQSDMIPNYYKIGYRSKVEFMYDSEIENPWALLSGHFDLAFIVVFLLPLLIFALTYNLLSAEREAGTLRMLMSQPLSLATLLWGKVLVRAAAVLGCATLLPAVLLIVFRPAAASEAGLAALGLWMLLVVLYGVFWFALAFAVNAFGRSSAANALILIACWTVLVLVAPVLINLGVNIASPAPSRTALATETRVIESESLRRYDDLFSGDYRYIAEPETLLAKDGRIEVPARTRASFLSKIDMDQRIDALLKRFDTQLQGQQAIVDRLGFISPAVVAHEGFSSLAGNGSRRYLAFKEQVSAFHDNWQKTFRPRILNGIAMTEADLRALPYFQWRDLAPSDVQWDVIRRILVLAVLSCLLGLIGAERLRRYSLA